MKRSQIKRGTSQLKRTPLKRVSDKLKPELRRYASLKRVWREMNRVCLASPVIAGADPFAAAYCEGKADENPHHMMRRGPYLNDTSTWLPVCLSCHRWIESHATKSRELGLIKR